MPFCLSPIYTAKPVIVGCWNFELYDFVSKMWMWILDKKLSFATVWNLKRRDCYVQNFLEFKEFEGDKRDMRIKPNTWLNSQVNLLCERTSLEFGGKCNLPLIPRLIEYKTKRQRLTSKKSVSCRLAMNNINSRATLFVIPGGFI